MLLNETNSSLKDSFAQLKTNLCQQIIGQESLVDRLMIALLADGHLIVEGAPGLAKTRAINALSKSIEGNFHRIQFTPDLLPADLTGTEIYRPQDGSFRFEKGPLFHNLVLADEINRAPAKVQSALLEAMAERQVTVGSKTYKLPELFLVMATQNPIEQEGTYPLPEAQLDRFLMHVKVDYPDASAEAEILKLTRAEAHKAYQDDEQIVLKQEDLFVARDQVLDIHMSEQLEAYIIQLIVNTRDTASLDKDLNRWLDYGASPRATISLDRCARAAAWLAGRDYVTPEDIQNMAYDILRHRLILTYEAEAEGVNTDMVINRLIQITPVA
ncbi:AAA family ATPase [Aliikangiella coralliicola]|uniref:MoxR family ATPase n=1 Tax=Aliikangiella coralliicola TaxID=2592383 RepID=A0A545TST8_9GAMM|nr:MoxR family ATPase [Aliikangiella coralliicola]TQV80280.1 MoxR family ATPase [Aliikangiella coralliicola]